MSVKSNGESSSKKVISGSVVYPSTASWPQGYSDNFFTYIGSGSALYKAGVAVTFVNTGASGFRSTPIITATISGATAFGLSARVSSVTKDGFNLYVYNTGPNGVDLSGALTVNWIATEASSTKAGESPNPNPNP